MSKEIAVAWKIRIRYHNTEVEVVGMNPEGTKKLFDQVAKEYGLLAKRAP